jgi:choline dehydrogenase
MSGSTVIVGAGSAGGALAARLSEDTEHEVILIEAGPSYLDLADEDLPADIRDAGEMSVEAHDWGLEGYFVEPASERPLQPYPRGRVVGGSGSVNAAIGQRGTSDDFARWNGAGGADWEFDDVLPFFRKLENDLDYGERPYHGVDGPVPIKRHGSEEWAAGVQAFAQACREQGFDWCDDFNAPGARGVGPTPRNLRGHVRASAAVTYLKEAVSRPNLTVISDATTRRVLFEGARAVASSTSARLTPRSSRCMPTAWSCPPGRSTRLRCSCSLGSDRPRSWRTSASSRSWSTRRSARTSRTTR